MTKQEYGTPEFYATLFSDIMADVGSGIKERDAETALAMMQGFELAISQWMTYHDECIKSYQQLHARFLGIHREEPECGELDEGPLWGPWPDLRQRDLEGDDPSAA